MKKKHLFFHFFLNKRKIIKNSIYFVEVMKNFVHLVEVMKIFVVLTMIVEMSSVKAF